MTVGSVGATVDSRACAYFDLRAEDDVAQLCGEDMFSVGETVAETVAPKTALACRTQRGPTMVFS